MRSCSCSSGRSARPRAPTTRSPPAPLGIVYAQRAAGDPSAVGRQPAALADRVRPRRRPARPAGARRGRRAHALDRQRRRASSLGQLRPDRVVLVARPRALLAGAQARRRGARRRHRLADPGRLRHLVGHEHGRAGGSRRGRAAAPAPSRLDAGADQVGARADGSARSSTTPRTSTRRACWRRGGGMIDVQAADAPGLFASPCGRLLRPPAPRARRDALDRAQRRGRRGAARGR